MKWHSHFFNIYPFYGIFLCFSHLTDDVDIVINISPVSRGPLKRAASFTSVRCSTGPYRTTRLPSSFWPISPQVENPSIYSHKKIVREQGERIKLEKGSHNPSQLALCCSTEILIFRDIPVL